MKKALVIGLGISGASTCRFLLHKQWEVVGVDCNETYLNSNAQLAELKAEGLKVQCDTKPLDIALFELVVVSPGVPREHPFYAQALEKGIEVVGEAELAFRHLYPNRAENQPSIAITGTNGKTTVTLLVAHILNSSGIPAKALGNIGSPLIDYAEHPVQGEVIVAELSSYQLETMISRVFDAGIILNITADHLDRYASMRNYASAKCRLQNCIKEGGAFYVHYQTAVEFGELLQARAYTTFGHRPGAGLWTDREKAQQAENIEYLLPLGYRNLGIHESENALAAWALVQQFGVSREQFLEGLQTFIKPAHRIEFVREIEGVLYYDDSKGTNVDAAVQAVASMPGPVVLIAGGVDKGGSYTPWIEAFRGRVKKVFAIGQAAAKIQQELKDVLVVEIVDTLSNAVSQAAKAASQGDCVLLSPGCASFDMFRDYAHRGEEFKRHVQHLEERRKP